MEKIFTPLEGETAYIRSMIESEPWRSENVTIRGDVLNITENNIPSKTATTTAPKMERAIFNPPATIVFWEDGDKTVVKCDERDAYDAKYGLILCWMKKLLGGKSRALNDALHVIQDAVREQKTDEFDEDTVAKALQLAEKVGVKEITGCPLTGLPCGECPFVNENYKECVRKMTKLLKAHPHHEKQEEKTDD